MFLNSCRVDCNQEMEVAVDKMVARRLVAPNEEYLDYETVARGLQGCDRDPAEFEEEA